MSESGPLEASMVAWIPASRMRALVRAAWLGAVALLCGAITFVLLRNLDFSPSAVTNRLVEYSLAVAGLPPAAATTVLAFHASRWLLLCLWPGPVGFRARPNELTARLAAFGTRRYPAVELECRYPYELIEDEEEGGDYEAFLPEEQQRARLLPRIRHAATAEPLNRTLLRFTALDEPLLAQRLGPVIAHWRGDTPPR